jgi:hypothetical protein
MIKVKLTRIESSHRRLRTDSVEGLTGRPPEVGQHFQMDAEGLCGVGSRYVETSPVRELSIREDGVYVMRTDNSLYTVEILP